MPVLPPPPIAVLFPPSQLHQLQYSAPVHGIGSSRHPRFPIPGLCPPLPPLLLRSCPGSLVLSCFPGRQSWVSAPVLSSNTTSSSHKPTVVDPRTPISAINRQFSIQLQLTTIHLPLTVRRGGCSGRGRTQRTSGGHGEDRGEG